MIERAIVTNADEKERTTVALNRVIQGFTASLLGIVAVPTLALATPSTTYWAPSTATCQARGVPHITYDTYFWKGPVAGTAGAKNYPIDTGLTMGVLPFDKVHAEVGFDLLLPSPDPFFLNFKVCTPEASLLEWWFWVSSRSLP